MADVNDRIDAFWKWFGVHQSELAGLSNPDEPLWESALAKVKEVDSHLWFELSAHKNPAREFVITAEGHVEAFPVVESLVERAPRIEGWSFFALKPPMGFAFETQYEGISFDASSMWFLPLESASHPEDLGIRVGVPGIRPMDRRRTGNAVLVILDTALGERSAALDIQFVEVCELPDEPESAGYIGLRELANYIAWRKGHPSS